MKPIIRVAKLELNILFYSPIAWFLLTVLLVQCGMIFPDVLDGTVSGQLLQQTQRNLTYSIFGYPYGGGLLPAVGNALYLYMPLLTMGLISRETHSGTIKLLYSSPLNIREIVFGKFGAMMVLSLLMVALIGLFMIFGGFVITSVDMGPLFSGLLGLFLSLCAYSAIGLFMSCLTSYQVVVAISTLVVFSILHALANLWQGIDFVRDLTYFLSIAGRANKLYAGLFTTKDLFYFSTIVYMFLGFSICKLLGDRQSRPFPVRAGRYAGVFVSALLIGYITSRPGLIGYYDVTATKRYTLTPNAQQIVRAMGDTSLEVTSYINLLGDMYVYGAPDRRNEDMNRWELYTRFKSDIKFRYVYYYDSIRDPASYKSYPGMSTRQIAERLARLYRISFKKIKSPAEILQLADLRQESNQYVMQLKYKERSTFLRLFHDQEGIFPNEQDISAALKRLTVAKPPKIVFAQGDLERSPSKMRDRDYALLGAGKAARHSLLNQGYDVDSISLKTDEIPADITALVIADPKTDLDSITIRKVRHYIDEGGNLLVAGEPGKQQVLNPLLKYLGVQLIEGELVQQHKDLAANMVLSHFTNAVNGLSAAVQPAMYEERPVSMSSAAALSYIVNSPFSIHPLLLSDTAGWITKTPLVLDSADIRYTVANGDLRGAFPTALDLTRRINNREQRIVITGDADFLSNGELNRWNTRTSNFIFGQALFAWFAYDAFPINVSRPGSKDNRLALTQPQMVYVRIAFRWVLPALFAVFGTVILLRRKRK